MKGIGNMVFSVNPRLIRNAGIETAFGIVGAADTSNAKSFYTVQCAGIGSVKVSTRC